MTKEKFKLFEEKDEAKAPILSNRYDYAEGKCGYVIPDGYEFDCIKEGFQTEIILKPKKPTYPKTYEECCNIVKASPYVKLVYDIFDGQTYSYDEDNLQIYENLRKLTICRDAYWKVVGEQIGLDKPWEPDWNDNKQRKFGIYTIENQIRQITLYVSKNLILVFPTEEVRDAFYENFKDLIEDCKELL